MQYALGGVRDAHVRPGDEVMVFGLGAIGLLAVALSHRIGAKVIAVDPLQNRREVATQLGASLVLDPTSVDIGQYVKSVSSYGGCDAIIETSGSPYALQQALRGLAYGGTIAYVAFAKEFKGGLNFGREAHFNNPKIIFSRAANEPNYDYPRWDRKRIEEVSWSMLMSNAIDCKHILSPVISFNDSAEGYMKYVDQEPHLSIKLGIIIKEDHHVAYTR
jgi:threonine dehydrogenase-like Zn-dependent dehydrogenase